MACTTLSAARSRAGDSRGGTFAMSFRPVAPAARRKMMSLKKNVKGLLTQRVRLGLFTVPLWVVGAVFLARRIRDRRRYA